MTAKPSIKPGKVPEIPFSHFWLRGLQALTI